MKQIGERCDAYFDNCDKTKGLVSLDDDNSAYDFENCRNYVGKCRKV